jgi:hypothetical protein
MSRVESVKSHQKKIWCRGEDVASAVLKLATNSAAAGHSVAAPAEP